MKNYINKETVIAVVIAIILFLGGMAVGGKSSQSLNLGQSGTRFPSGISADTTSPSTGEVRGTTLAITSTSVLSGAATIASVDITGATFTGAFTQGGGISTISTTSATYTMTQAQLEAGGIISIADNATGAALALTLPASSTWTTLIPNAGDSRAWIIDNLHTDAATTTTITKATGVDLLGLGANDDIINGAVSGKLTCFRKATTNVMCILNEYVSAQ